MYCDKHGVIVFVVDRNKKAILTNDGVTIENSGLKCTIFLRPSKTLGSDVVKLIDQLSELLLEVLG